MIAAIAYDEETETLEVEFAAGAVYRYRGIDQDLFEDFRAAPSKGRYFNRHIKDAYPWEALEQAGPRSIAAPRRVANSAAACIMGRQRNKASPDGLHQPTQSARRRLVEDPGAARRRRRAASPKAWPCRMWR